MSKLADRMIAGVAVIHLPMHRDVRGHLTELFSRDRPQPAGFVPAQWHVLASQAGTLRGMHAHALHDDLKITLAGEVVLGLKDLRRGSPSEGAGQLLGLSGAAYKGVLIPAGVAHGILAVTDSLVLVGVTLPYDGTDEFECAWNDPRLGIEWPTAPRLLSERDRQAGSLADLLAALEPHQPLWRGPGS